MRDPPVDALRAALAEGLLRDAGLRRAYADLRETCGCAIDPRHAERDLARLLARLPEGETPVSARFEAVLARLPSVELSVQPKHPHPTLHLGGDSNGLHQDGLFVASLGGPSQGGGPSAQLLAQGLEALLRSELGLSLRDARVLDPWAGDGALLAALRGAACYGNVADIVAYASAVRRLGEGICLADSFRLPERTPTPGFAFSDDENTERIALQQTTDFAVVVSDLREATTPDVRARRRVREAYGEGMGAVRWMTDRLAARGIVAFLSDGAFIDAPSMAGMRAALEREFGHVAHVVLGEGLALTFLVRGGSRRGIFLVEGSAPHPLPPSTWEETPQDSAGTVFSFPPSADPPGGERGDGWRELEPTPSHVWRTEILAPEWAEFVALVGERGAVFAGENAGAPDGRDASAPGAKGARRVMRRPFSPAWRVLDRVARREPWPAEEPTIVVLREPFGVIATNAPVDRKFGGKPVRAVSGAVSPSALRRFRAAYGAGVVDRDVFDFALALLHHPAYRTRYREDLRRGVPRLPMPPPDRLLALAEIEDAPPVGPGAPFGTGWLDPADFEPGSVPDFDDPFASPYARPDVEPGFLLLCGLGAALYRVQADFERLLPLPLERIEKGAFEGRVERMRLSPDRTRLVVAPSLTLNGVPPEASRIGIGARSGLEWLVKGQRVRRDFDPNRPDDPERIVRLAGQVAAAGLETERLAEIVGVIDLGGPFK